MWAAGRLVLEGHAGAGLRLGPAPAGRDRGRGGHDFESYYGWHYPPPPCSLRRSRKPALSGGVVAVDGGHAARLCRQRSAPSSASASASCWRWAFPGVLWNISVGQNGFLDRGADRRHARLASNAGRSSPGCCLGLLTYKPQFGVLFPLVLMVDGRWRGSSRRRRHDRVRSAARRSSPSAAKLEASMTRRSRSPTSWCSPKAAHGLMKMQSLLGLVRWLGGSMTAAWLVAGRAAIVRAAGTMWLWAAERPLRDQGGGAVRRGACWRRPTCYIYDFRVSRGPARLPDADTGLRDGFLPSEVAGARLARPAALVAGYIVANTRSDWRRCLIDCAARRATSFRRAARQAT